MCIRDRLKINDLNIVDTNFNNNSKEFDAMVKIRYNMHAKKAHVKLFDSFADITFYEPVNSVTSGQAGVIYDLNEDVYKRQDDTWTLCTNYCKDAKSKLNSVISCLLYTSRC